jgi:PAS domain S-box-containing protein
MTSSISYKRVFTGTGVGIAGLGIALVLTYILLGHAVLRAIYDGRMSIFFHVMRNKAVTPINAYFAAADEAVLKIGVGLVLTGLLWLLLLKNPLGVLLSGTSLLIGLFVVFLLLDLFPALVKPLHFDMIPYFNYRLTYVPDPVLGFRETPFRRDQITNFRGFGYSPVYGIDVQPRRLVWQTDNEGFRNRPDTFFADVAVIGSSFAEYGTDLDNTYPSQLEIKLNGRKVVNLAKAGYGPLQYVEVLKRYALEKKPQYVLFTFYPVSDIDGHLIEFLKGQKGSALAKRSIAFGGIFPRFGIALQQTGRMLTSGCWTALTLWLQWILGTNFVHPDVAVLNLPNNVTERLVFFDQHSAKSTDNLLQSPEWRTWEQILITLKNVSEENQIVPLLVYIPAATEVYAEYSTPESGANWLRVRESQIATASNNEDAARRLAAKIGIELISLRPAFRQAARQGKLIYYPTDAHWNEEGREIAARVTADALKYRLSDAPTNPNNQSDSVMVRTIDGTIKYWNHAAEQLYGWRSDEVLGKVSHNVLQTRFPESLERIDAELVQSGRWEGKLVHATRDGRRVVVVSQWILYPSKGDTGEVLEINKRTADF